MTRAARIAVCAAMLLAGCSDKGLEQMGRSAQVAAGVESKFAAQASAPAAQKARFIAISNYLSLEVDAAQVQEVLDAARNGCQAPECQVLESNISRDSRTSPPSARIRLRIVPGNSEKFIEDLVRRGDVIERRTESEDKTDQVVDVEARLRTMTELRDRLRKLAAAPNATVKDLVEVESQLARVQGDLDSATGRRQVLANETEKVLVTIDIKPRRAIAETGAMAPVVDAVKSIGRTLAMSLAGLISFIVAAAPWVAMFAAILWAWRRWRRGRRKSETKAS